MKIKDKEVGISSEEFKKLLNEAQGIGDIRDAMLDLMLGKYRPSRQEVKERMVELAIEYIRSERGDERYNHIMTTILDSDSVTEAMKEWITTQTVLRQEAAEATQH